MDFSFEKNRKTIVAFVFILSAFLIVFRFTETPKVWLDEGVFSEIAKNLAWHGTQGLQTSPGQFFIMRALATSGYPLIFPVSASVAIFGNGIWQTRLPMLLYMFSLVLIFYFFTKRRYGFYPAIFSVLSIISFAPFYGNGRPVQGEVPGLVFLSLGFLSMLLWEEGGFKNKKWAICSGLFLGISAAAKPIYLLVLLASSPFLIFIGFKKMRSLGGLNKREIFLFLLGFLMPLVLLVWVQFPNREALGTIVPVYKHLIGNHESTQPIFVTIQTNLKRFFTESTPVLFLALLSITLWAFLFKIIKERFQSYSLAEFGFIFFILINWASYLVGTGWYRYFFPAYALVYVVFPASVWFLSRTIKNPKLRIAFLCLPAFLVAVQFVQLVFFSDVSFTTRRERNHDLSVLMSRVGPDKNIFLYDSIEALVFLKNSNYSQYLRIGDSVFAGDKNALSHPTADFILTNAEDSSLPSVLPCYDREAVNRYYFFTKKESCLKK